MNRELLITFLAAADQGSFTAAAETLHLAQSSVSRRIAVLEEEMGVGLFDREGPLTLTPAGERLTVLARRYLTLRQRLAEDCRIAGTRSRPLKLLACSPGSGLLDPLLEDLVRRDVAPVLRLATERNLSTALRSDKAEIILTCGKPPEGDSLVLWEGPLWVCGRRDDSFFADPRAENLAGRTLFCGLSGTPDEPEALASLKPGKLLESNMLGARLPLLCAGKALALVPPGERASLPPELTACPALGQMPTARYTLALPRNPTPAARLLLELAQIRKNAGDFDCVL